MSDPAASPELQQFYRDLGDEDLQPLWTQTRELMTSHPKPAAVPYLWTWKTLRRLAERAGELVPVERGGDRRVLALSNPGLGGLPYATGTLWGAVQYLGAGEHAPGHRHTPGAVRFVLEGDGVWTTVDGDACDMHPGDLVLTPGWTWHDHNSDSDAPMIWFDGLDLPTVAALDTVFFEPYPVEELQPVEGEHNRSARRYAGAGLVPLDDRRDRPHSPLLVYRWAETDAALTALLAEQGGPVASLEFVDPTSGRPALPTLGCEMHRLASGAATPPARKTGSSVFVVYRGAGSSVIDGRRFRWSAGDMFVVPSWAAVEHHASEESDLFAVTDAPVLKALQLYFTEQLSAPQQVTGEFDPASGSADVAAR